jgi:hypothetical protein
MLKNKLPIIAKNAGTLHFLSLLINIYKQKHQSEKKLYLCQKFIRTCKSKDMMFIERIEQLQEGLSLRKSAAVLDIDTVLARRYVHITNFETAHAITLYGSKDKPLKAYQFVKDMKNEDVIHDCLKCLNDIVDKQEILYDMAYIETNKK